jgi:hypothetical protein
MPPGADGSDPTSSSKRFRRSLVRGALLLGGGLAGMVVGIALSAAFAGAAEAAPPPVLNAQSIEGLVPAVPVVPSTPSQVSAPGAPAALSSVMVGQGESVVSTVTALPGVETKTIATTVQHLTSPIVSTLAAKTPSTIVNGSLGSLGPVPAASTPGIPTTGTSASSPIGTATSSSHPPAPRTATPTPSGRPPRAPSPSQLPPLTGTTSAGYSSAGQGSNPLGALTPTFLLLPALLLGALLLAREKTPLTIFSLRYSPPG